MDFDTTRRQCTAPDFWGRVYDYCVSAHILTEASGINASVQVVGFYHTNDFVDHGFLYSAGSYALVDFAGAPPC